MLHLISTFSCFKRLSFHAVLPALNSVRFFPLHASVSLQTNPVAEELLWKARKSQRWDTRRVPTKRKLHLKEKINNLTEINGSSQQMIQMLCKISGDQTANEAMKQAQGSQCMKLLHG